jgi:hypothetical protein
MTVALLSTEPAGKFTQLPALPTTLQDWQVPWHELLQQTVSTQKPLPQSLAPFGHSWPLGFLFDWQMPLAQYWFEASQVVVALWSCKPAASGRHDPGFVPLLQV